MSLGEAALECLVSRCLRGVGAEVVPKEKRELLREAARAADVNVGPRRAGRLAEVALGPLCVGRAEDVAEALERSP